MPVVVGEVYIVVLLVGGFAQGVQGGRLAGWATVGRDARLRLGLRGGDARRHDVDPVVDDDHHSDGKVEGTNRCIKLVTWKKIYMQ